MESKDKYLFAIDLDGTLLSDSVESSIHPITIEAIKRATNEGHIVCLVTGRPWIGSKDIYKKLGLKTIVGNLNGAHIHNPTDEFFIDYIQYINLNEMLYILGDDFVKDKIKNLAIEGPSWVQLEKPDEKLEQIFSFFNFPKKTIGIDYNKLPLKPTGIIMDLNDNVDVIEFKEYLQRKFSDLGTFSYWSKGEGESVIFDITAVGVDKGRVLSLLVRFYDINVNNVVAIGDSFNDVSMLENASHAIVMKNADERMKKLATEITTHTNKEGGVGHFMNNFLDKRK